MFRRNKSSIANARLLSQAMALEEMNPPYVILYGAALILGLLAVVLGAAAIAPVVSSANAQGVVQPSGAVKPIQHLAGGLVAEVYARNGARVAAGTPILRLSGDDDRKRFDQVSAEYFAAVAELEGLSALIEDRRPDFRALPETQADLATAQMKVYLQSLEAKKSQRASLVETRRQAEANAAALTSRIKGLREERALLTEEFEIYRGLVDKGYVTKVRYMETRRELARVRGSLGQTRSELEAARATVAETDARLAEFDAVERKKVIDRMGEVSATLAQVKESRARLQGSVDRLLVTAPIAGIVHNLRFRSLGAVVAPGDIIAEIVPEGEPLIVEAKVLPRDVGFLREGQTARITVDGFDVSEHAALQGVLAHVSASSLVEQDGEAYFLANLEVDPNAADNAQLFPSLRPGMAVQASIVTGEGSLLRYLIEPVYVSLETAFSER